MPDAHQLDSFFTSYRGERNDQHRNFLKLHRFFETFKKLSTDQKVSDLILPTKYQITFDALHNFVSKFKPEIRRHFEFGYGVNVWDVAGVGCDEMRNSSILSWLLDCNGSHGQGNIFLEGLLSWLANNNDVPEKARENLPIPGSTQNARYWTRVESLPLGEKESRVDIEISGPFVLIIEIKVNSQENSDQLRRYIQIARNKAINNKWGVVYLTRKGSPAKDKPVGEPYDASVSVRDLICRISWPQMSCIINKALDEIIKKNNALKGSFIEHHVKQFCQHIKSL